jgi:hypothetical protein
MSSDTQLGLNFAYMLTNNIGVELLAATPFEHDVKIKGTALPAANGKLGMSNTCRRPSASCTTRWMRSRSSSHMSAAVSTTPGSTTNTSAAKRRPTASATSRRKFLGSGMAGRRRLHADRQHHAQRPGALHRHRHPRHRGQQPVALGTRAQRSMSMSIRLCTWSVWATSSKADLSEHSRGGE